MKDLFGNDIAETKRATPRTAVVTSQHDPSEPAPPGKRWVQRGTRDEVGGQVRLRLYWSLEDEPPRMATAPDSSGSMLEAVNRARAILREEAAAGRTDDEARLVLGQRGSEWRGLVP